MLKIPTFAREQDPVYEVVWNGEIDRQAQQADQHEPPPMPRAVTTTHGHRTKPEYDEIRVKILAMVKRAPGIRRPELRDRLGLNTRQIGWQVRYMAEKGLIKQTGKIGSYRYWPVG